MQVLEKRDEGFEVFLHIVRLEFQEQMLALCASSNLGIVVLPFLRDVGLLAVTRTFVAEADPAEAPKMLFSGILRLA